MQATAKRSISPERVLAGGFLAAILAGGLLLAMPFSSATGQSLGLFNGLFTATSAVCVTGLVAVDTGTALSFAGQCVLLTLIQLGGLGFMIFATLVMVLLGRKITLHSRVILRESMNAATLGGLVQLTQWYGLMTLGIELLGAGLLALRFVPALGWRQGVFYSVFHAVSAFCNAGFDLMGGYRSLTGYWRDPLVLGVIAGLIQLGGLGFSVLLEVISHRCSWPGLSVHARLVLAVSLGLTLWGTGLYMLLEWHNPLTLDMQGATVATKLLGAYFQSVTMRTAGFNSVDLAGLTDASKLVSVMLMFIGASPASTGGGVKTTTMSVLWLIVTSVFRGQEHVNVFGKRLPTGLMRRALAILFITGAVLLVGAMALTVIEKGRVPMVDILFECASAVATVGVSSAGTPKLSPISRGVLMPMMYFGRVGPLTLGLALYNRQSRVKNHVKFPEEKIMIG